MTTPAAVVVTPAPSAEAPSGNIMDQLVGGIGDDFDLGNEYEEGAETGEETALEPDDFDEPDDDDGEPDGEPTKPEVPSKKPPVPVPAKKPGEPEPKPKVAASPLPLDKGTEDKPYGVNDLPADRFVKVKINGQEEAVPMRELADGYIRKRTFDSTLSKANQALADAERIASSHLAERTKLRGDIDAFLGDDERLFSYLLARDPDVMLRLGSRIGEQYGAWQKDPQARAKHDYDRQQRALATERQRVDKEKREWQETRQRQEASENARRTWEPIWRDAIKEAGFPKLTPEFQDTVKALVAQAQRRNEGKVDVATFKAIVKRAAALVAAETVTERAPAAPVNPPKTQAARTRSAKNWDGMTHAQKMRDPAYLLRMGR